MESKKKILLMSNILVLLSSSLFLRTGSTYIENTPSTTVIQSKDLSEWWWTDIELLSDMSSGHSYNPCILIDESENIHIVWVDQTNDLLSSGTDSDIFYMVWTSATESWSSLELISSESTGNSRTPKLAIDAQGVVHVVCKMRWII
ncbi:MAG: hypothetical protein KGD64_06075 [Candidatus Heimdallarchaeota archaeon]|nr:hypothetical protein [Candidatus Heimdallarchaeota archaeon]